MKITSTKGKKMKKARSNIFGIVFDANEIDHKDCETFQIVCRECREYVFKTVRSHPTGPIHFFSHYRADPEANAMCEERAKTRLSQEGSAGVESGEDREQTLQHYLACFTSMVDSLPYFPEPEKIARTRALVGNSKGATDLRKLMRDGLNLYPDLDEMIAGIAYGSPEEHDEGIFGRWDEEMGWVPRTQFARSIQVRVATDMLRTLLTKPAVPAWNTLYASAWIYTTATSTANDPKGTYGDYSRIIGPILAKACAGADIRREIATIAHMPCTLPYLLHGGSWLDKLQVEVMNNLFSLLLSIDYARWSRERQAGREATEISAELRAAAGEDYERQKDALRLAGVDLTPPKDDEVAGTTAKRMAGLGNQETQKRAAIHRSMTGEGREFRHGVEAPGDLESVEGMMVMARPMRKGRDASAIQGAIRRAWPTCLSIQVSDTGVPNSTLNQWKDTFGVLRERLAAIAANDQVEKATVMFTAGLQAYAVTITKDETIVEKLGDPLAA